VVLYAHGMAADYPGEHAVGEVGGQVGEAIAQREGVDQHGEVVRGEDLTLFRTAPFSATEKRRDLCICASFARVEQAAAKSSAVRYRCCLGSSFTWTGMVLRLTRCSTAVWGLGRVW
jgi:hypothetical protein